MEAEAAVERTARSTIIREQHDYRASVNTVDCVRCDGCQAEHLTAFSCKRCGVCPSCGARRMAERAALLPEAVFPERPVRQWTLSVLYPLRFLFASHPEVMGHVLGIDYRCIAKHLIKKAGFSRQTVQTGAVTLIQRFGAALNLNIHFHMPRYLRT
jgi:hypothetical protein